IVSLDPNVPITPVPLIAKILRTRKCIPGSIFLVEGIDNPITVTLRFRTARLLLGDGKLVIQALARPEVHPLLDEGEIFEGAYVRVGKFEMKILEMRGKKRERMAVLVVEDVRVVGWHRGVVEEAGVDVEEAVEMIRRRETGGGVKKEVRRVTREEIPRSYQKPARSVEEEGGDESEDESEEGEREESPCPVREPAKAEEAIPGDKEVEEETDYFSGSDDAFETLEISVDRATERRTQAAPQPMQVPAQSLPQPAVQRHHDPKEKEKLPWMAKDPTEPMKLTNLQAISKLPYRQNWMVNVLAVVTWLSDVEPTYLPPNTQRRARLADHTTDKQMLLTILLDAADFTPQIGSVVLLVGVKNHQFEGGSLRKYASDRPKTRKRWWTEHPEDSPVLEWCQEEATALKEWWGEKMLED
ncbi:hypothetical protein B0T14DRAFT_390535, partial [Immersiella caudata]